MFNWFAKKDEPHSENANHQIKALPVSFVSKLFNIAPSQWSRVLECWFITFFFKFGYGVGWTVVTAAFISRFGIEYLPALFIGNALLIVLSTSFFEQLIIRMKREVLMIVMIILGAFALFFGGIFYFKSPYAFFILTIFAESVFLAQFNVFIPILVGDRFTPVESQKTFPFIESAETIGGMLGGLFVGILASKIQIPMFVYFWIFALICVIFVFVVFSHLKSKYPPLIFRARDINSAETSIDQVKLVVGNVKKFPFIKGLIMIILFQWVFMNVLEFQFTKALEQSVTNRPEATIAVTEGAKSATASILGFDFGPASAIDESEIVERSLTVEEQDLLTQRLGALKGMFHFGALLVQIIFASRLITALGVVGSMILHPVIMLMSLVGMFLHYGFLSSVISKFLFDTTNVIHKNAYFASHYAFPKFIRDQTAEFLEGIVRPVGTIVGMCGLFILQMLFSGKDLSMWVHITMFMMMAYILVKTIKLQPKYTDITKDQLFSNLPYPEKLNAIDILSQKGHRNAPFILVKKWHEIRISEDKREDASVKIKIMSALGQFRDYETLPDILEALYDANPDVRLEAAISLMNFRDIGDKFYSQAFSRYRMIETLKDVFRRENSASVRSAIIRVFSLIKQPDIVTFLLGLLNDSDPKVRADCIYTLGLFRDPNTVYYIAPSLTDSDPFVRAGALIGLAKSPKHKETIRRELDNMLESDDHEVKKAGIFAVGELGLKKRHFLNQFLYGPHRDIVLETAFALTKISDAHGFYVLLNHLLSAPVEQFESARRFFRRLDKRAKHNVERVLTSFISEYLRDLSHEYETSSLSDMPPEVLEKLRRLYVLLDQHEELFEIQSALDEKKMALVTDNL